MPLYISVLSLVFVLNILGFFFAYYFKTDKLTDISYSLSFICAVFFLLIKSENISIHFLLSSSLIIIWAIRLGLFLMRRIIKMGKDSRFDSMRNSFLKFGFFWLFQALSVSIIIIPLPFIPNHFESSVDTYLIIGIIISFAGLLLETIADYQKAMFKRNSPEKLYTGGLYTYIKYPNFLGEILFWTGIWIMGINSYSGWEFISIVSPLYILILLRYISGIPIIEKKRERIYQLNSENKAYAERTPLLVPFNTIK